MSVQHEREHQAASKYITFKLGGEEYGVELLKIRELIGGQEVTRVPSAKSFVRGLVNLRGKVIIVVDLRVKFGMPAVPMTGQSVIIVVQMAGASSSVTTGILVDEVLEVRAIRADEIEPTPELHENLDVSFILGVAKVEKRIVFLLDIERILNSDQQSEVRALGGQLTVSQDGS